MSRSPLVILAHIHQHKFFARIAPLLHIRDVRLFHPLFRVIHDLQKLLRVCHRHYCLRIFALECLQTA